MDYNINYMLFEPLSKNFNVYPIKKSTENAQLKMASRQNSRTSRPKTSLKITQLREM